MKFEFYFLLQKLVLENECGIFGNFLKIFWLEGFLFEIDVKLEIVFEYLDLIRIISGGVVVDFKV